MSRGKESSSMTLSAKEKIDLSRYRLEKAREFLNDAKNFLDSGAYDASVNRSYYAMLNSARSILVLRGIDAETHDGVKTMLSKEFIKTGLLPKEFNEVFRNVQGRRIDSDYGDYVEMGKDEALDSFTRAEEFVQKISELVSELVKDLE